MSALLSGASLNVALDALVRFHIISSAGLGDGFSSGLLVGFGVASLALALPFIVTQGDIKRLLAYSSIENMGLLAVAVGFGGAVALAGFALVMLAHALTKSVPLRGRRVPRAGGTDPADRATAREPCDIAGRRLGLPARRRSYWGGYRHQACSSASSPSCSAASVVVGGSRPA